MDNFIFFTWPATLNSESRRRPAEPEHGLLNIDGCPTVYRIEIHS